MQWVLFGAVAVVVGLVTFVLAMVGLVAGALLAGIFSVITALSSRRRGSASGHVVHTASDECEAKGGFVELDKDAYTTRVVDEEKG